MVPMKHSTNDLISEGDTPLLQTPLVDLHQRLGAKLVPFAGYEMPLQYPMGILGEHLHTRTHAGLFDVSHMGPIRVKGPQAAEQLERLIPCDLKEMQVGEIKYGLLLNKKGGIIDDLLIAREEDFFLLVVNAGRKHEDLHHLQQEIGNTCDIIPLFKHAMIALQGPEAKTVMEKICPKALTLTFMTGRHFLVDGAPLWISRTGYTGEDGFELIVPPKAILPLVLKILSFPQVKPIGLGARDSLRLEAGLCLYGHDLTEETTPVEAALTWALGQRRRQEGGFLGDQVIKEQIAQGAEAKRIGLVLTDRAIAREGALIKTEEGDTIGRISSGGHSPTLGIPIAMGYIETPYAKVDTSICVDVRGQLRNAVVTKLPFVPHTYYRG